MSRVASGGYRHFYEGHNTKIPVPEPNLELEGSSVQGFTKDYNSVNPSASRTQSNSVMTSSNNSAGFYKGNESIYHVFDEKTNQFDVQGAYFRRVQKMADRQLQRVKLPSVHARSTLVGLPKPPDARQNDAQAKGNKLRKGTLVQGRPLTSQSSGEKSPQYMQVVGNNSLYVKALKQKAGQNVESISVDVVAAENIVKRRLTSPTRVAPGPIDEEVGYQPPQKGRSPPGSWSVPDWARMRRWPSKEKKEANITLPAVNRLTPINMVTQGTHITANDAEPLRSRHDGCLHLPPNLQLQMDVLNASMCVRPTSSPAPNLDRKDREALAVLDSFRIRNEYARNMEKNWLKEQQEQEKKKKKEKTQKKIRKEKASNDDAFFKSFFSSGEESDEEPEFSDGDMNESTHETLKVEVKYARKKAMMTGEYREKAESRGSTTLERQTPRLLRYASLDVLLSGSDVGERSSESEMETKLKGGDVIERKVKYKMRHKARRRYRRYKDLMGSDSDASDADDALASFRQMKAEGMNDKEIRAMRLKLNKKETEHVDDTIMDMAALRLMAADIMDSLKKLKGSKKNKKRRKKRRVRWDKNGNRYDKYERKTPVPKRTVRQRFLDDFSDLMNDPIFLRFTSKSRHVGNADAQREEVFTSHTAKVLKEMEADDDLLAILPGSKLGLQPAAPILQQGPTHRVVTPHTPINTPFTRPQTTMTLMGYVSDVTNQVTLINDDDGLPTKSSLEENRNVLEFLGLTSTQVEFTDQHEPIPIDEQLPYIYQRDSKIIIRPHPLMSRRHSDPGVERLKEITYDRVIVRDRSVTSSPEKSPSPTKSNKRRSSRKQHKSEHSTKSKVDHEEENEHNDKENEKEKEEPLDDIDIPQVPRSRSHSRTSSARSLIDVTIDLSHVHEGRPHSARRMRPDEEEIDLLELTAGIDFPAKDVKIKIVQRKRRRARLRALRHSMTATSDGLESTSTEPAPEQEVEEEEEGPPPPRDPPHVRRRRSLMGQTKNAFVSACFGLDRARNLAVNREELDIELTTVSELVRDMKECRYIRWSRQQQALVDRMFELELLQSRINSAI